AALHDLSEVVGSALRRASKMLDNHKIVLELASDLPMLELDAVLFEQVVFNLLDNAAKYSPEGSTVSIRGWRDDRVVHLQILDEGPGIWPEDLERIFDKFYRAQKGDHVRAGTGLGLVIARGEPSQVRRDPGVVQSYLGLVGDSEPAATRPPRPVRPAGKQILEVSRLCAGYGRMTVIRDIDLNVSEGELVLLCGRNGAGKSTLLNALTGFPRPQSGAVSWLGGRMDHLPVSEVIRSGIGLVPQERGVIAGQSVDANLRLGTIGLRLGRRDFAKRREEMLSLFPALGPRLAQLAGTLSGGERQMLALARVLIRRPRLLLLDEPTIGLAPTIVDQLTRIIDTVHRDGLSIIVAEQNVGWVAPLADRAYMLEGGHIQASGRPDEIMRQDQLTEAYLGRQVA
ncbi:MAG: ATP-binding cassette domain-containing protein, partial [Rhodospirillales bacterium]|nr:ATP-binding cassette domain-containing protein [Rhodospirillales bacterium]